MSAAEASPLPTLASSKVITPDDHGAYVTITASLMLVSMVLLTGLRLSIRFPFRQLFGVDDAAIVISAICAIAQTVAILKSVKYGLGRHVSDLTASNGDITQKLIYVANILFVVSLTLSKTATSLLMSRLTRARNQVVAAYVTSAIIMIWGIAFILGVSINCNALKPWDSQAHRCTNWQEIWAVFGAIGLSFELLMAILPAYLLWGLQMSTGCKAIVAFGFCFRLIMIPIEAFRLHFLSRTLTSTDPTFDIVPFLLLTQVEEHYSLIAATIPCLRPFLKAANTGLLDVNPSQVEQCGSALNSGGTGGGGSYAMRSREQLRASSATAAMRPPSKMSATTSRTRGSRCLEIATGFKAFDAHNHNHSSHHHHSLGAAELHRKGSGATLLSSPSPPLNLDSITLAPSEPMSTSPTIAKHMFVAAAPVRPIVTAQAVSTARSHPPSSVRHQHHHNHQGGGDGSSSFTTSEEGEEDSEEMMIIKKETDLSVRYSPLAVRRGDAQTWGGGVPMGLDLERIDEGGAGGSSSAAGGGGGERREESSDIGRARGGQSLDLARREVVTGRIPIGLSVGRHEGRYERRYEGRRERDSTETGRLGSWLETATPSGKGSWESGEGRGAVPVREWDGRYMAGWREQRERYWSRR